MSPGRAMQSTIKRFSSTSTKDVLNRTSRIITQPKSQGASQAMLYATEGVETDDDLNKAMVGVASIW